MKSFEILLGAASALALAIFAVPAFAQGGPGTIDRRGLEKVKWYKAPLQIQIIGGPKVREFPGGTVDAGALPQAGFSSNIQPTIQQAAPAQLPAVNGTVMPGPGMATTPAGLPPAQFSSNVPVRRLSNQMPLPAGSSTNLMGRLMKPQPAAPQQSPRRALLSQPTGRGARHIPTPSAVQHLTNVPQSQPASAPVSAPAQSDQTVRSYGSYPGGSGSGYGAAKTSTSVTGVIKRGSLLK